MIKEYIPVKRVFEINDNKEQLPLSDKVEIKNNQALLSLKHIESTVLTGSLSYFFGKTCPNGYLVCNGAEVSIETYQDLYDVIENTYGEATESGKFKLPDLTSKYYYVRGGVNVGTAYNSGLPNISGLTTSVGGIFSGGYGSFKVYGSLPIYQAQFMSRVHDVYLGVTFDASNANPIYGNSEIVQPPSLTLLPCIKY